MASSSSISLFLLISLFFLLTSPSHFATCPTPTFKSNKHFTSCTILPSLSSHLYYTFNATNSSLSVAFVAKPSKPSGWVAWAINPTSTKMVGSQAFVAYTSSNGTLAFITLNITSYSILTPGNLAFDFWDTGVELTNGSLTVFASVKVPEKAESVNQVWQVGPGVNMTTGYLLKHDVAPENLAAYGPLNLTENGSGSMTNATNTTIGASSTLRIGHGEHVAFLLSVLVMVLGVITVL